MPPVPRTRRERFHLFTRWRPIRHAGAISPLVSLRASRMPVLRLLEVPAKVFKLAPKFRKFRF